MFSQIREETNDAVSPKSAAAPPILAARGLGLRLGAKTLLEGVDAAFRTGRRCVVLGANGAGKSLLLGCLHGLRRPSTGEIAWRGGPLDAPARRAQAMVFQHPVMMRRSVIGNLSFALKVGGVGGAERKTRIEEALAAARLEHVAHRPARGLSGGEQQRLAIARALARRPEMLFLDEPTASLDPASSLAVERLIERASAAGVTIVMVTHNAGEARRLGDDLIFLHQGRVAEAGDAKTLLDAPRSLALQAWLEGRIYLDPRPGENPETPRATETEMREFAS